MVTLKAWALAGLALCLASFALALDFPPLTGRVVDQANIMTAQSRTDLEAKLKELEDKSSIQLVVATVKSLQGSDVETYANNLFRSWKLGEDDALADRANYCAPSAPCAGDRRE